MKPDKRWIVYLVRCADNSLYCGITNDLNKRLHFHNRGTGAKYTRSRTPVILLGASAKFSKSDALKLEYRIKKTPANRKLYLLENVKAHTEMGNTQTLNEIRNELKSAAKSLRELTASLGKIVAALEKIGGEDLPRPKAKRAPVRKKVVVKNGVVEKIKRIPAAKIVYDILQKSDQGMDTAALMKATGFDQRKIHNITFRLKREGKIENAKRGVYKAV